MKQYKKVLTIAGSDSGGGAGIQADLKTISACGCYAMSAITAITAQNTLGVSDIHIIPTDIVVKQIEAVIEDIGVDAVKLGMLPTHKMIVAIAGLLERYEVSNIVLDPVMVSTSGSRLIDEAAVHAIRTHLFPIATVITPNVPETEYLTGISIRSEADFQPAAERIKEMGAQAVLFKSGHLDGEKLTDYLFEKENFIRSYRYDRINTLNTHGTGCTLSSAIASYMALGFPLAEAVQSAEDYLHKAILNGAEYRIGNGHGPVHHFFRFWQD